MNVTVEDLVFQRGRREVLSIPRLSFAPGRVTVLLGPNGSGKSTLLRLISGLDQQSGGTVKFDGSELGRRERTRLIAYAFQSAVFVAGTVRENMDLALRLRGVPVSEREPRISEAALACGIVHLLDRNAGHISGGEAQRANLARALALRAPLTLLDEPLSGLDTSGRRQLLHALPGILREFTATAVVVTHDREEAIRLADNLVILAEGSVRADGPKGEILSHPPDPECAELLGFAFIETGEGPLAVAPGALRTGNSGVCFALRVETVTNVGSHTDISGWIGATPVTVPSTGPVPVPGETVVVSADPRDVVRFRSE